MLAEAHPAANCFSRRCYVLPPKVTILTVFLLHLGERDCVQADAGDDADTLLSRGGKG